jgi:hypothetical protein
MLVGYFGERQCIGTQISNFAVLTKGSVTCFIMSKMSGPKNQFSPRGLHSVAGHGGEFGPREAPHLRAQR